MFYSACKHGTSYLMLDQAQKPITPFSVIIDIEFILTSYYNEVKGKEKYIPVRTNLISLILGMYHYFSCSLIS